MKINTKYLGEVEVGPERFIKFENGLFAFEDIKEFALLPFDTDAPFFVLQSLEYTDLAFVLANPFHFFNDYKVKLPDSVIDALEIEKEEEVAIFVLLTVEEPFEKSTANLQAPVVINTAKQKGKQFILTDGGFQTKHYLLPQETATVGEAK